MSKLTTGQFESVFLHDFLVITVYLSVHQCDDKDFRGPSWRRQFPPRDVHGISMMPGSAETLPAGFRLTTTSGHSRRLPPEGKCPSLHLISQIWHLYSPIGWLLLQKGLVLFYNTWHFLKTGFQRQRLNPPVALVDQSATPERRSCCSLLCCDHVSCSLWLCDGCSAVLYEALDDSPDDMYLDWFQGQLCPSEGPGLVGPACNITLHILPPLNMVSANHCPAVTSPFLCGLSPSPRSFSTTVLLNLSDNQLQGCCFAELQNSLVNSPWWLRARGSSYGLGPMLAGVTLEVTVIKQQNKRWLSSSM